MTSKSMTAQPPVNPFLKLSLELGPLILFFVANSRWGIFTATGVFMVAVMVALVASYKLLHRVPIMTVVSAVVVIVFGGLTLVLQNDVFIKIKPTIIYLLFCATLLGGLALGKPLLALVFDSVFDLTAEGWRKLTWRWALFFLALAVVNEIVWRTQTTDAWLSFKVFGVVPLTFLFAASQYPLLTRYDAKKVEEKP
ncbi:MAG: septation protein A [Hyphomicrobiales bacterium]|nr:septation protein A [Hyphomicrobiales bacterium]MBV8826473.1 septation protein A [Hyphomicrobiales bacterium]MBV9427537.1 septation protein A [Bradyrhizobiaceae bacterium]